MVSPDFNAVPSQRATDYSVATSDLGRQFGKCCSVSVSVGKDGNVRQYGSERWFSLNCLPFRLGSQSDSRLDKSSSHSAIGNAVGLRQIFDGLAGLVSPDQVVNVRKFNFSGHVYDLQSQSGVMSAASTIVSNCRCITIPLRISDAAKYGVKEAQEWLRTGVKPANPTYCLHKIPTRPTDGFGTRHGPLLSVGTASSVRMSAQPIRLGDVNPWQPYNGPRGGTGWQRAGTDEVRYVKERPGAHETGGDAQKQPTAPTMNRKQRIAARTAELKTIPTEQLRELRAKATGVDLEAMSAALKSRGLSHLGETPTEELRRIRQEEENAQRRQEAKEQKVVEQRDAAAKHLKSKGWKLDAETEGSQYYRNGTRLLRVSDHAVPATPEREFNAQHGGFSWAASTNQIILPVADLRTELDALTETNEDEEIDASKPQMVAAEHAPSAPPPARQHVNRWLNEPLPRDVAARIKVMSELSDADLDAIDKDIQHRAGASPNWSNREAIRDERGERIQQRMKHGKQIGDVIDFVRHGEPPKSGVSTNKRDSTAEEGVSVYMLHDGEPEYVGWHFGMWHRPAYSGKGTIVAWGSDGEPIVKIQSIKRDPKFDRSDES